MVDARRRKIRVTNFWPNDQKKTLREKRSRDYGKREHSSDHSPRRSSKKKDRRIIRSKRDENTHLSEVETL